MYTSDLVERLAKETGVSKAEAKANLNSVLGAIKNCVQEDGRLILTGFGTFKNVTRAARVGRNPSNGALVEIPAKVVMKFTASK